MLSSGLAANEAPRLRAEIAMLLILLTALLWQYIALGQQQQGLSAEDRQRMCTFFQQGDLDVGEEFDWGQGHGLCVRNTTHEYFALAAANCQSCYDGADVCGRPTMLILHQYLNGLHKTNWQANLLSFKSFLVRGVVVCVVCVSVCGNAIEGLCLTEYKLGGQARWRPVLCTVAVAAARLLLLLHCARPISLREHRCAADTRPEAQPHVPVGRRRRRPRLADSKPRGAWRGSGRGLGRVLQLVPGWAHI